MAIINLEKKRRSSARRIIGKIHPLANHLVGYADELHRDVPLLL